VCGLGCGLGCGLSRCICSCCPFHWWSTFLGNLYNLLNNRRFFFLQWFMDFRGQILAN
jgi:hypothetical protein